MKDLFEESPSGSAVISEDGLFRYLLKRKAEVANPDNPAAVFIMLNPSTADAALDDPTIRRCKGFAKAWGCAGLIVANLYAFRATSPADMFAADDPIGPDNDDVLTKLIWENPDIVCAWGAHASPERVKTFLSICKPALRKHLTLWCLGATKEGAPRHPLYIKSDQELIEWPMK